MEHIYPIFIKSTLVTVLNEGLNRQYVFVVLIETTKPSSTWAILYKRIDLSKNFTKRLI